MPESRLSPLVKISPLLDVGEWLMLPGERAALQGVLAMLEPSLAIEVGTHRGGSLELISARSRVVHAFDLELHPELTSERFPNVTFHIGDSHALLPAVLQALTQAGETVDFALVDGDHSAEGARRDLEDLLSSPSVSETVILLHDTLNESVRAGLEEVDYRSFERVRFVDLDFVQGRVMREGPQIDELWYGLGLVLTGDELVGPTWPRAYAAPEVYDTFSDTRQGHRGQRLGYGQLVELQREVAVHKELVRLMERSWSWRLTAPLRAARRVRRQTAPRSGT
jgi:hypothetical protein